MVDAQVPGAGVVGRQEAQQEFSAYLASLKARTKIEVNKANLDKKGG